MRGDRIAAKTEDEPRVEFLREKGNGFHLEGVVFFSIGVEKGFGAKTVNGIGNGLVETFAVG